MSEERAQILEMLVTGRITVEQADQLLEAVDAAANSRTHESASLRGAQRQWDERADGVFAKLTVEQIHHLHDRGVTAAFIRQLCAALRRDLSISDLIKLYERGVTPRFRAGEG
jgi:anion-transporting  ArsA/GET3 family ATPase